jgi:shikimate kinase
MYFNSTALQKTHSKEIAKIKSNNLPIFLIGMMGSGKTSIGKILSQVTSLKLIDTDSILEQEAGISINEIFALHGEEFFRQKETELLKKISQTKKAIISCGGGMFTRNENISEIAQYGISIFLNVNSKLLEQRLQQDSSRPLISTGTAISEILSQRIPFYTQANIMVDIKSHNLEENVAEVLKELYKYLP